MSSDVRLASQSSRISDGFTFRGEFVTTGFILLMPTCCRLSQACFRQLWKRLSMPDRGKSLKQRAREMAEKWKEDYPSRSQSAEKKGE